MGPHQNKKLLLIFLSAAILEGLFVCRMAGFNLRANSTIKGKTAFKKTALRLHCPRHAINVMTDVNENCSNGNSCH